MGYTPGTFGDFLGVLIVVWPIIFLVAFALANTVVGKISTAVIRRYLGPNDSTNAFIVFNIVVCVLLMSVILTFLGGLIGESIGYLMGGSGVDVIGLLENWPRIWPRNFCIAFWVEMLVAQPVARGVMVRIHKARMGRAPEGAE